MTPTHWLYPVNAATDALVETLVGPIPLSVISRAPRTVRRAGEEVVDAPRSWLANRPAPASV